MWNTLAEKISQATLGVLNGIGNWLSGHALNIVVILVAAFIMRRVATRVVTRLISRTIRKDMYPNEKDRQKRVETLQSLVAAIVRVSIWIVAGMMIINEMGINTAPLIASAGIVGIILGFGTQSLVKDFVTGIFIITENQYRVGDIVEISGISGTVEAVTIRTTILRDLDGNQHHIPNGSITLTTNKTMDFGRLNETINVAYDTDLAELEHVINHVGDQVASVPELEKLIVETPKFSAVRRTDKDGILIRVLGKTVPGEVWRIRSEFYIRLLAAFKKHGIEIPYPQLVVHTQKEQPKKSNKK